MLYIYHVSFHCEIDMLYIYQVRWSNLRIWFMEPQGGVEACELRRGMVASSSSDAAADAETFIAQVDCLTSWMVEWRDIHDVHSKLFSFIWRKFGSINGWNHNSQSVNWNFRICWDPWKHRICLYKCRKFSSMARLSLLSRPCSRCWNVFVVFQEAEFCLWNLEGCLQLMHKAKEQDVYSEMKLQQPKVNYRTPLSGTSPYEILNDQAHPHKKFTCFSPSPPRHSHVLPLLDMRQVVVFEHPGQIRPGYCPAITVHTSQAGYLHFRQTCRARSFCVDLGKDAHYCFILFHLLL